MHFGFLKIFTNQRDFTHVLQNCFTKFVLRKKHILYWL